MQNNILDNLYNYASNINSTKNKHICVILHGKKIISYGSNSQYGVRLSNSKFSPSLHAEQQACRCIKTNYRNMTILVIRLNSEGKLCNSKPCKNCCEIMRLHGIRKVIYSNEHGKLESYKLSEFYSDHISKGYRLINNINK